MSSWMNMESTRVIPSMLLALSILSAFCGSPIQATQLLHGSFAFLLGTTGHDHLLHFGLLDVVLDVTERSALGIPIVSRCLIIRCKHFYAHNCQHSWIRKQLQDQETTLAHRSHVGFKEKNFWWSRVFIESGWNVKFHVDPNNPFKWPSSLKFFDLFQPAQTLSVAQLQPWGRNPIPSWRPWSTPSSHFDLEQPVGLHYRKWRSHANKMLQIMNRSRNTIQHTLCCLNSKQ